MKIHWCDVRKGDGSFGPAYEWFERMVLRDGTLTKKWSARFYYYWIIVELN